MIVIFHFAKMLIKFKAYGPHPIFLTNVFPPPTASQQHTSLPLGGHQHVGLPLQSSTSSIPSIIYPAPYTGGQAAMPMVAASSGVTGQSGGYTLPPTAAYFPIATYATLQQQHQHQSSIQSSNSAQQSVTDKSSQRQLSVAASTASVEPSSRTTLNVADTVASSVPKSSEVTPTVTQPNTPDLLIHRRQVKDLILNATH